MQLLLMSNGFFVYLCAYILLFYMYYLHSYSFQCITFFHSVSQNSSSFSNFFFFFSDLCVLLVSFLKELNITNSKRGNQPLSPSSLQTESGLGETEDDSKQLHLKKCTIAGKAHGPTYYNTESCYIVKDIKNFVKNSWQLKQYIIF